MFLSAFKQLRQMRLQAVTSGILAVDTIIAVLQCQEVVVNIAKIVKHVANSHILRVFAYLIFMRSTLTFLFSFFWHSDSQFTALTPGK